MGAVTPGSHLRWLPGAKLEFPYGERTLPVALRGVGVTLDDFGVGGLACAIRPSASNSIAAEGLEPALQPPTGSGAPSRFEHVIWKTGVDRRGKAICWS